MPLRISAEQLEAFQKRVNTTMGDIERSLSHLEADSQEILSASEGEWTAAFGGTFEGLREDLKASHTHLNTVAGQAAGAANVARDAGAQVKSIWGNAG